MRGTQQSTLVNNVSLLALAALVLSGCLMDEPEPAADDEAIQTLEVSGSVGDGPVANANLKAFKNDNSLLAEFESTAAANYNVEIRTKGKFYPLTIEATGGTDIVTNMKPDFILKGAVTEPGKKAIANINPFSTFAMELAHDLPGGINKENISQAQDIVVNVLNCGLTSLVSSGPMGTRIDTSNIAEIVRASEALGETVRRTRDLLQTFGFASSGDQVLVALASDLTDSVIDGRGGTRADARTAAIATIVSALVQLETMSNELRVNGVDATSAMNAAMTEVMSSAPSTAIEDLTVTPGMLMSVNVGLSAAFAVSDSPKLAELQQAVFGLQAGMDHSLVRTLLPADYQGTLENVLMAVAGGDASVINTINGVARNGGEQPTVSPPPNTPPTISGNPPSQINANDFYDFTPTASDPDGNVLIFTGDGIPDWANLNPNTGRLSGTPGDTHVGTYSGITIMASDDSASDTLGPFSITVEAVSLGSVTLNWAAPTQNEDGTPLTDLSGYKFYWGTSTGNYPNSVTLNNPGLTTYVVDNLAPGTYEFVATSFNTSGIESAYSNPATKTVP